MTARIRLATVADAAAIAAIYAPAVLESSASFEIEPPDAMEMAKRIEAVISRTPWLVYETAAGVVGYSYASPHRERAAYQWSVEVSAYVSSHAQRTGVARALYASLFVILAEQGFYNAYAGITLPNDASEGFHRALGFEPVGVYHGIGFKFGAWHDVVWLERAIRPKGLAPEPPISLTDLVARGEIGSLTATGLSLFRPV